MSQNTEHDRASAATARGTLATTPAAHLLVFASDRRLTGTIELADPDGRATTLVLSGGWLTKVSSNVAQVHLGRVLFELGAISLEVFNDSLRELAEKKLLHGQILLERKAISTATLVEALRDQAVRKARHVFELTPSAEFTYFKDEDRLQGYGGTESIAVNLLPIVWRAVHELPRWATVHAALRRIEGRQCRVVDRSKLAAIPLDADQVAAIDRLSARPTTLAELVSEALLSEPRAMLLMYLLLLTKQLRAEEQASIAPPRPPSVRSAPCASPPEATVPERRPPPSAPPPLRSAPHPSGVYGSDFQPRTASGSLIPIATPAPFAAVCAAPRSAGTADLSIELAARKQEIVKRALTIHDEDYFQRLELPRDASPSQVSASFALLRQLWHPDRMPVVLADVRDELVTVFECMEEARRVLSNPSRRTAYVAQLGRIDAEEGEATSKSQFAAPSKAVTSALDELDRGVARMDWEALDAACVAVLAADSTNPDALGARAWLAVIRAYPSTDEAARAQVKKLDAIVAGAPRCGRAYFFRGQIFKQLGQAASALQDFRRAAALGPYNVAAAREIRLQEMRGAKGPGTSDTPSSPAPAAGTLSGLYARITRR